MRVGIQGTQWAVHGAGRGGSTARDRTLLKTAEPAPLVAWYLATDRLAAVDGEGDPDTVTRRLLRAIESRLARR